MIEYQLDKIDRRAIPPTRNAIDQVRHEQMQALKALRRKVLQITEDHRSAA